jgi:hypothetical protein
MVPVGLIGVIERAGLASLVHDGLALEQRQEVWWLLALGDADLAEEKRGERDEIGRGKEMGRGEERNSGCEWEGRDGRKERISRRVMMSRHVL